MRIALSVKNMFSFIDGSLPALDVEDGPIQYQTWFCTNNMVISWLLNSISKEILPMIVYYQSATEI